MPSVQLFRTALGNYYLSTDCCHSGVALIKDWNGNEVPKSIRYLIQMLSAGAAYNLGKRHGVDLFSLDKHFGRILELTYGAQKHAKY